MDTCFADIMPAAPCMQALLLPSDSSLRDMQADLEYRFAQRVLAGGAASNVRHRLEGLRGSQIGSVSVPMFKQLLAEWGLAIDSDEEAHLRQRYRAAGTLAVTLGCRNDGVYAAAKPLTLRDAYSCCVHVSCPPCVPFCQVHRCRPCGKVSCQVKSLAVLQRPQRMLACRYWAARSCGLSKSCIAARVWTYRDNCLTSFLPGLA
jgi:hypothetical protein